jgi:hypothetical protein
MHDAIASTQISCSSQSAIRLNIENYAAVKQGAALKVPEKASQRVAFLAT